MDNVASYYAKNIPRDVLALARARAEAQGRSLNYVIIAALRAFGRRTWSLPEEEPAPAPRAARAPRIGRRATTSRRRTQ